MDTQTTAIIQLMIKQEEAVQAFYSACAEKFPPQRDFWVSLAMAEQSHACFLREIAENRIQAAGFVDRRRFQVSPIQILLVFIEKQHGELKRPDFTLLNALAVAREFENSMIEKRFFEVMQGDSEETKARLNRLQQETTAHKAQVEKMLATCRV